jgi:hypothetical protein
MSSMRPQTPCCYAVVFSIHFFALTFSSSSLLKQISSYTVSLMVFTYFNCFEKSSLVSSSSQLSSQRCVFPPGTSASSCGQSRTSQHVYLAFVYNSTVPSTGKSSNSSSSSSAATGFCGSFVVAAGSALVDVAAVDVDMAVWVKV